jgi:hypothetical protein
MIALIPTLLVALMIIVLIAPRATQDILGWRVPISARGDPERLGMRLVPSMGILVFGFAMFRGWDRLLNGPVPHLSDPIQAKLAIVGGAFLLALGLLGCLWPVQFMERAVPALRGKVAKLEPSSAGKAMLIGKGVGVIFLLSGVWVVHRCGG